METSDMKAKLAAVFVTSIALWSIAWGALPEHQIARAKDVSSTVSVVDENGDPVSYGEVWRVVTPILQRQDPYKTRPDHELPLEYLNQTAQRYKDVAEFAGPWRPGFVEARADGIITRGQFSRLVPTNHSGGTSEIIKVERDRPESIAVRYAAMAYGFRPAVVDRLIESSEGQITVRIVLQRDEALPIKRDLEQAFGKLRYEATPDSPGYKGEERMEEHRGDMLALAAEAEASGEKKTAARIYAWAPFIPTRTVFDKTKDGLQISGYTREDERSERNVALLQKAYALDPGNRYLQMKTLILSPPAAVGDRIKQLEGLLAGGNDMWPPVYFLLENAYWGLDRRDDAKRIRERYEQVDPNGVQNWPEYRKIRRARYVSLEEFGQTYIVGRDVNSRDVYFGTPLRYAIQAGRVDLLDWLLQQGIKTPFESWVGTQAVSSRNPAMVRRLLELGPSVVGESGLRLMRERAALLTSDSPWDDPQRLGEIKKLAGQDAK